MSLVYKLLFPENELLVLVIKFATLVSTFIYLPFFLARGTGGLLEILSGGVPSCSPNPDPISDQIFHTRSQTRPLKSIPVFRPGLWAEIMLSLLRLGRKQKTSSNSFQICVFLFLSYS